MKKSGTDQTAKAVCYKLSERRDEQVDWHTAVKIADEILKSNWRGEQIMPEEYSAYCNKLIAMLTKF